MLDIVPIQNEPYKEPTAGSQVVLATKKGTSSIWWVVTVKKPVFGWAPNNTMRLEGVTTYKGVRCQVIAWYRLGLVEATLGTMQLHAPDPEEP